MPDRPPRFSGAVRSRSFFKPKDSRPKVRNYSLSGAAWRKLRAAVLLEEPLCRLCKKKDPPVIRAAKCVDHEDGDPNNNDPKNLQPLCWPCHSRKTAKEDGGFGNRRLQNVARKDSTS